MSTKKSAMEQRETFTFLGYGEPLPRFENFVELGPKVVDAFGIPVLPMHVAWGDNERNMVKDAGIKAAEMLEAGGMKISRFVRTYIFPVTLIMMSEQPVWGPIEEVGPKPVSAKSRREKSLCYGRLLFQRAWMPESDADHQVAHGTFLRVFERPTSATEHLTLA